MSEKKLCAGVHTCQYVAPDEVTKKSNAYSVETGTKFRCRIGPDYSRHGKKDYSASALTDLLSFDVFRSKKKLANIAQHLHLPPLPQDDEEKSHELLISYKTDKGEDNQKKGESKQSKHAVPVGKIPRYMVFNFMLPGYSPPNPIWGSTKTDGEGSSVVLVCALNKNGIQHVRKQTHCGKLLCDFVHSARDMKVDNGKKSKYSAHYNTLKGIPMLNNGKDCNLGFLLGKLVNNYNGKPFLTGPTCHELYVTPEYFAVDIDVHKFCYAARKGFDSMRAGVEQMDISFGLVCEARDNDELPERMLVALRAARISLKKALDFDALLKKHGVAADKDGVATPPGKLSWPQCAPTKTEEVSDKGKTKK